MSNSPIPLPKKLKIAYFYALNNTYRSIAEKTSTSKTTVQRVINLMDSEEIEEIIYDFKTQLRHHFVLYKSLQDPFITNKKISQNLSEYDFKMSESSVSRTLTELGIKSLFQRPKEKLNQNQKIYRLKFSIEIQKSELFLFPWSFSDESIISLEPMKKKVKIFPLIDNPQYFFEKQGYPPHIMVWGCIAKNFKSPLIRIQGKLNSTNYIQMLTDEKIIELLNGRFGEKGYVFQQDGAPAHRANKTREFLEDQVILLLGDLHWPENSPDLNVIEHLWGIIKAKIDLTKVSNLDELFIEAKRVWDEIPMEVINNLIDSFQDRIKACRLLAGESLNGKKNIQEFRKSYENGIQYIQKRNDEIRSINDFISQSSCFFSKLSRFDLNQTQCNQNNCERSIEICRVLPQDFFEKLKMPKNIISSKVKYVSNK